VIIWPQRGMIECGVCTEPRLAQRIRCFCLTLLLVFRVELRDMRGRDDTVQNLQPTSLPLWMAKA
jgi:hypothetical protein